MATVNSTIKRIIRQKNAGIKSGQNAIEQILRELQVQVQLEIGQAALGSWDEYHLKRMLNAIERHIADFDSAATREISGLLNSSWEKGVEMVDAPLRVAGEAQIGGFGISKSSLSVLQDFSFRKIGGLSASALEKIQGELTLGILGGKTPHEVSLAIGQNLKHPSVFRTIYNRAQVITQTEMGRTFSLATQKRMEQAAEYVEGFEKQWKHAGHPKEPRPTHLAAHDQHVPVDESFVIDAVMMMFPRDPAAPVNQIIRCGCDHVPYNDRWN